MKVIGIGTDTFGFGACLRKDLISAALGFLRDDILLSELVCLIARDLQSSIGFFLCLRHDAVALRHKLLSFFHFFGDGDAHLVDQFQHTVFIHDNIMRKGHSLRIVEEFFQSVDQLKNVHRQLMNQKRFYVILAH